MGFKCDMNGLVSIYSVNCHKVFSQWLLFDKTEQSYIQSVPRVKVTTLGECSLC